MRVRDVMTREVKSCYPAMSLGEIAIIMWDHDCGSVPIVDGAGRVTGMITDRDICMAVATSGRLAGEISGGEVASRKLVSCEPDTSVEDAMKIMEREQLRRLPVAERNGALVGLISINDLIVNSKRGRSKKAKHVSRGDVMATLKAICEHRTSGSTEEQRISESEESLEEFDRPPVELDRGAVLSEEGLERSAPGQPGQAGPAEVLHSEPSI